MKSFRCLFLYLLISLVFCGLGLAGDQIPLGSSEQDTIDIMGEPLARGVSGSIVMLKYPMFRVRLQDDQVIAVKSNEFKKNLVIPPMYPVKSAIIKKSIPTVKKSVKKTKKYKKIKVINKKGKSIKLESLLVPGRITIIDFYAHWCGPCVKISPKLEKLARKHKDVYLRKVNIVNWKTPVVKQFKIRSVPHVRVYDEDGNMVGEPTASYKNVKWYVEKLTIKRVRP